MNRSVSVVIPALNEARYIEACLTSVLSQEIDGKLEVIVADGGSNDATALIARRLGAKVISNSQGSIPAGLNRGLEAARGDVIARFDAHSEMTPGYLRTCLRVLEEEKGVVNVGGWCQPMATGPWGRALGAAVASPVGVGNARIWREPRAGSSRADVDTVPFGCFLLSALRETGGWREDILANEDFELNHRLRRRGGRIVFDPHIRSIYRPRETYSEIVRQYWRYGRWKAVVLSDSPQSLEPRQVAPLALLMAAAGAPSSRFLRLALLCYAGVITTATMRSRNGWRTAVILVSTHVSWGAGLLTGLGRLLHDSRTVS
jgi:succinoglycan biosynthesis protein ExoA